MSNFATVEDVKNISGAYYDAEQEERISTLLPLVCDVIRVEGRKAGKDVDALIEESDSYKSVVKLITCDVVARVMRQSTEGEPMAQESQAALGYSWSGTYAIPGGGTAMALMENEKRILGFKRQRIGVIPLWEKSKE